jgi:outer membrane protein
VDLARVFAEFDMAKEKQQEFENLNMGYKNTLDSLALELDYLESQEAKAPSAELENRIAQKKAVYYQLDEKMQQKLGEFKAEADGQVWAQINSLTSEYGKSKGYEFIYGGNGTGSLMYAKETKDITQEVLNYINKKYAGE